MESLTSNKASIMRHLHEAAVTLIPSLGGLSAYLSMADSALKILVGLGTLVWLGYRIAIVRKEYKKK